MAYSKHPLARSAMKTAALPPGIGSKMLDNPGVQAALAGTAISAGVAGISAGASYLKDVYDRTKSFKEMLSLTPALRDHSDQAEVKRYFNSLHRVNPHFMNDPSVAGALVHRVIDSQKSLGGAGQPPAALATMVSELAKGRADMSRALTEEARGSRFADQAERHLQRNVEAGIHAFHDLRANQWATDADRKKRELEAAVEAKAKELRLRASGLEADADAAAAAVQARMGRLEKQIEAAGKRQAHLEGYSAGQIFRNRELSQQGQELGNRLAVMQQESAQRAATRKMIEMAAAGSVPSSSSTYVSPPTALSRIGVFKRTGRSGPSLTQTLAERTGIGPSLSPAKPTK